MHRPAPPVASPDRSRCPRGGSPPRSTSTGASSLSGELRERTRDAHLRAEHHPLQQRIVRGEIDPRRYAVFTASLHRVHDRLERQLDLGAAIDPRIAAVFTDHQRRLHHFDADLSRLGHGDEALPETVAAASDPTAWLRGIACPHRVIPPAVAWLGALYVLEGSSNGGRVIARVLRRAWDWPEDSLRSLDPHAGETRARWMAFRERLDAQPFDEREREAIVAAAHGTFEGISAVMDAVGAMPPRT